MNRAAPAPGERIRVLRIIARMNVGGPAVQVTTLMRGLDPDRYEQRLLVGTVGADESDHLATRAPDVTATVVPGLGRAPRLVDDGRALATICRIMADYRPHVVHTHTAKAGALGRVAATALRVPVVVHTFHGHLLHGYFGRWRTRAVVDAERLAARCSTALVAVGPQVRDDLLAVRIGRPQQYAVVPPGIRLEPLPDRGEARAALGIDPDADVVLYVGRLTRIKRPDRLLEVARRLRDARPSAVVVVAGDGELAAWARAEAAPLGDAVRFLGWRDDLETLYAAADVVLLTSDNEGTPVSLIEAAHAGRPVVATDVGSTRHVVDDGHTGVLCPPDAGALADAVLDLLGDPLRHAAMAAAAPQHAADRFGRRRLVTDTEALYQQLLATPARPRSWPRRRPAPR
jgi:glycosyltransferase involved in cell wall biosynthesis